MSYSYTFITILQCIQFQHIIGAPVHTYQLSHDVQSLVNINDINDLEQEHVKRAMVDVKTTINEVQKILETDPTLPRLTRGEIEELFENVTREEYEKSLRNGDKHRAKHMRALMLVLPYNTNNYSDNSLQELYTRPPVTKVVNVASDTKPKRPQQIIVQANSTSIHEASPTTYKPDLSTQSTNPKPTTFHPTSDINNTYISTANIIATTATSTTTKSDKFSSHYSVDRTQFHPSQPAPMRENVKDLLATIGLTAEVLPTTTTQHPPILTPELRDLLNSFGLLTNEEPPKHLQYRPELVQDDFAPITAYSFIQDGALDDDVFKSTESSVLHIANNYRMNTGPEMTAEDFSAFKPLPIPEDTIVTTDMEDFLKSYGLLDGNFRHKKSMSESNTNITTKTTADSLYATKNTQLLSTASKLKIMDKMPEIRVDFLAPELLSVLGNIGINNKKQPEHLHWATNFPGDKQKVSTYSDVNLSPPFATDRISNDEEASDERDYKNLNHLLGVIQGLEKLNTNMSKADIAHLTHYNLSEILLGQHVEGPNPVDVAETEFDAAKNEIKRQSNETTENQTPFRFTLDLAVTTEEGLLEKDIIGASTTSSSSKAMPMESTALNKTSKTTSTPMSKVIENEERKSDLENSFSDGILDPVTETPLPPPRRTGFYFLADWNSFLEVGEDPDKVVVRFDPKIGDPSRFLPVTVP